MIKRTLFLMVLFATLASQTALLAGVGEVSVSPAVVMLRGNVGQSTTQTLTFTNGTSRPLSFEMKAYDAVVRDGKRLFVEPGSMRGSIAATAAFSPKLFTVAPRQSVHVSLTITIPPQPAVRAIAVMCEGTTKLGTGPLKVSASVGTLLTFAIAGDVLAATASPLTVQPPTGSAALVAAQQLVNSGTEPVVATGMLAILNAAGSLAGKQEIPEWRLLPGEKKDMRVEYDGELAPGRYRAMITYDLTNKTLTSSAEFSVK
ncbi:MAG: hypothetical protein QOE82_340 [Thermoanaerobaculia bacterium]|jgi:hypothetical protein|nr:hypothetical protein [Thermoanaerobaculia bacterium]